MTPRALFAVSGGLLRRPWPVGSRPPCIGFLPGAFRTTPRVGAPTFPDTDRLLQCQELHAVSGVEHRLQSLNIVLTGDLRQKFPTLRRVKIDTIFHGPVAARNGASQSAEDAGYGRNRPRSRRGRTHEQECMADKKRVMGSRQRFVSCEIYDHKMLWVRGVDCGDGYTRRQHCVRPRRPRRSLAVRQAGDKLRAIANRIAITHCAEMKWRRATPCFES